MANRKPVIDPSKLSKAISVSLGDSVRAPFTAYLGDPSSGLVEVPIDLADHAGTYYIHGYSAQNSSISGLESETDDDKQYVTTALMTPNKIPPGLMIYGTAVKVKRESGVYTIVDLDGVQATEYLYGVKDRLQRSVDISQMDFGLIRPTSPKSMKASVSGAIYYLNNVAHNVPTLETSDFTSEIPGSSGKAKAIHVILNPSTSVLTYEISAEFDNDAQHSVVFSHYPSTIGNSLFSCGWIKVYNGQISIDVTDVLHAQEYLNKRDETIPSASTLFPKLISAVGEIVVDDNGEAVWYE